MLHFAALYLGLYCLPKFPVYKGLIDHAWTRNLVLVHVCAYTHYRTHNVRAGTTIESLADTHANLGMLLASNLI